MKKGIANTGAILIATVVLWLGCKVVLNMTGAEASVCALALAGMISVLTFYCWRPGGWLENIGILGSVVMFVGGEIFVGAFLLVDAAFAHVDLLDRSQWPKLWNAGGPFGFVLTAGMGIVFALLFFPTIVRAVILKAAKKCGKQHTGSDQSVGNQ
jgi:hypothetical protein